VWLLHLKTNGSVTLIGPTGLWPRVRALVSQIPLNNICTAERLQRNSLVSCVGWTGFWHIGHVARKWSELEMHVEQNTWPHGDAIISFDLLRISKSDSRQILQSNPPFVSITLVFDSCFFSFGRTWTIGPVWSESPLFWAVRFDGRNVRWYGV